MITIDPREGTPIYRQIIDQVKSAMLAAAQKIADDDVALNRRMGFNGAELVSDGDTILHHCNTGALATVDWGTALGVIYAAEGDEARAIRDLVAVTGQGRGE